MDKEQKAMAKFASLAILAFLLLCTLLLAGCPLYNVYSSEQEGKAEYSKAEYNRQIAVRQAQAKLDASKLEALAEIERAKGVAEANRIIGEGLKGNEAYLRYLWVNNLENSKNNTVIYVPTETGLPILEAGKRPQP